VAGNRQQNLPHQPFQQDTFDFMRSKIFVLKYGKNRYGSTYNLNRVFVNIRFSPQCLAGRPHISAAGGRAAA
jgi:hypothetical protein